MGSFNCPPFLVKGQTAEKKLTDARRPARAELLSQKADEHIGRRIESDRRDVSLHVNFGVRRAFPAEKNGAVQVRGLGLEMRGRAEPANRNKG
jgi:hypothetical protein